MAMQEASANSAHTAQVVGNAFVQQYYHVLHNSPDVVFRFYQESSLLSRPDSYGSMKTVTSLNAINDMVMSFNYEDYKAEIETADAQESYEGGVTVLVTGCLTGKDNVPKKFTQSFFLAPQDQGFYVRNDILRFALEKKLLEVDSGVENCDDENALLAPLTPDPVPTHVPDHHPMEPITSFEEEVEVGDLDNGAEVCDPSDNEGSVIEDEIVVEELTHVDQNESLTAIEPSPAAQEDAPKKTYASILKVMRGIAAPQVHVPNNAARVAAAIINRPSQDFAKPTPKIAAPSPITESAPEKTNVQEEAQGYSIYVKNLPLSATVEQVAEALKNFGLINRDGVQVRSNKGFCFGFVEFESLSSMQSALEASPITIGDRQAEVEEKRTTTRVGSGGRGRFNSGRGGFRNENFRGRGGNFSGGGRGYGRSDFRNQGEFSGRPRGSTGRSGDGYQRVNPNASARGGPQGGTSTHSAPA